MIPKGETLFNFLLFFVKNANSLIHFNTSGILLLAFKELAILLEFFINFTENADVAGILLIPS